MPKRRKYGPQLRANPTTSIPLSKTTGRKVTDFEIRDSSPAPSYIEAMPEMSRWGKRANYYRKYFEESYYRRAVWQYLFGGILRAIFGVYAPYRYWDRELEKKLTQELKADYEEKKRKGTGGIYTFKMLKYARIIGAEWYRADVPGRTAGRPIHHILAKGRIIYVRMRRDEGLADVEFVSYRKYGLNNERIVMTVTWKVIHRLLTGNYLKRMKDGKLYAFGSSQVLRKL